MQLRKVAVFGVIALLILACVVAAGCTSSDQSNDNIVGTWGSLNTIVEYSTSITTFLPDGTGKELIYYLNGETKDAAFTWKKVGDSTYNVSYGDGEKYEVTIVNDKQQLQWKPLILTDYILGTRTSTVEKDGVTYSDTTTFNSDYTGSSVNVPLGTKDKITSKFTWSKIGMYTYLMTYENGTRYLATYNRMARTVSYEKIDYSEEPIIGTHTGKETFEGIEYTYETTYNADGTGESKATASDGTSIAYDFLWKKNDTNVYTQYYHSPIAGNMVEKKQYNPEDGTITLLSKEYQTIDNQRMDGVHVCTLELSDEYTGTIHKYDGKGNDTVTDTIWEYLDKYTYKVTTGGIVWYATYDPETGIYDWTQELPL